MCCAPAIECWTAKWDGWCSSSQLLARSLQIYRPWETLKIIIHGWLSHGLVWAYLNCLRTTISKTNSTQKNTVQKWDNKQNFDWLILQTTQYLIGKQMIWSTGSFWHTTQDFIEVITSSNMWWRRVLLKARGGELVKSMTLNRRVVGLTLVLDAT